MNSVDNYRFLVQTCDRDFEKNYQTFAKNLAEGIENNLRKTDLFHKRCWYVSLDLLGSLKVVEDISNFSGDGKDLPPFDEWLHPNLERNTFSEEQVRYFQRRMGIIGRLVEKTLNQLFASGSLTNHFPLQCKAVYIDNVQKMNFLRTQLRKGENIVNSGARKEFFDKEMSKNILSTDQDLSLRIQVGYEGKVIETSYEDPTIPLPDAEGGESALILEHRKMETDEKIKRMDDLLQKRHDAFFRETTQALLCVALIALSAVAIHFEVHQKHF